MLAPWNSHSVPCKHSYSRLLDWRYHRGYSNLDCCYHSERRWIFCNKVRQRFLKEIERRSITLLNLNSSCLLIIRHESDQISSFFDLYKKSYHLLSKTIVRVDFVELSIFRRIKIIYNTIILISSKNFHLFTITYSCCYRLIKKKKKRKINKIQEFQVYMRNDIIIRNIFNFIFLR